MKIKNLGLTALVAGVAAACSSGFQYSGRVDDANVNFVRDSKGVTAAELKFDNGLRVILFDSEDADFKVDEILVYRADGSAKHYNKKYMANPDLVHDAQGEFDNLVDRVYLDLPRYAPVKKEIWEKF